MLLFAALMQTADRVVGQGQTAAWGGFGAMLLHEDAGGYVLVGVGGVRGSRCADRSFRMRLHEREKQKSKNTRRTQHEKFLSPLLSLCLLLGTLPLQVSVFAGTFFRPKGR